MFAAFFLVSDWPDRIWQRISFPTGRTPHIELGLVLAIPESNKANKSPARRTPGLQNLGDNHGGHRR